MSSPWLVEPTSMATTPPRRRLIALPYAGSGAAMYEPFRRGLPGTAVTAVRLPGRESRFREEPLLDADAVIDALAPVVAERIAADRGLPWAVLGYSLGGLLAYELVARLAEQGGPTPDLLVVGGAEAPHVPRVDPPVSWLPDDELTAVIRDLGGTSEEVLAVPELVALVLPMVRADFRIVETYAHRERPPLTVPIVTYRGADDAEARPEAVHRWAELTTATTEHRTLVGGHFTISERPEQMVAAVGADLDRHL